MGALLSDRCGCIVFCRFSTLIGFLPASMPMFSRLLLLLFAIVTLGVSACRSQKPTSGESPITTPSLAASVTSPEELALAAARKDLLEQSWAAYRERFIQTDGRVIDWEAESRSTSEGQAYAMLRAVMIGDRDSFERTLTWAEVNLQRKNARGQPLDTLWGWKWGQTLQGKWEFLDANFASDADIDAVMALILAARRWQAPEYLALAQRKLADLWRFSTVEGVNSNGQKRRYLLPGPVGAFQQQNLVILNPSYFAPAAFRVFAQVDPQRDWLSLIDSSYEVLQQATPLSKVRLPNDWVLLDLTTGQVTPMALPPPGTSEYGFDAYRVWWRLAWDVQWFNEPRARQYLEQNSGHLRQLWRSQQKLPARIDLRGTATVDYEATSQYGMVYAAMRVVDPAIAREIEQRKLTPRYRQGVWDDENAYYTQNMVWLGLAPPDLLTTLISSK